MLFMLMYKLILDKIIVSYSLDFLFNSHAFSFLHLF